MLLLMLSAGIVESPSEEDRDQKYLFSYPFFFSVALKMHLVMKANLQDHRYRSLVKGILLPCFCLKTDVGLRCKSFCISECNENIF